MSICERCSTLLRRGRRLTSTKRYSSTLFLTGDRATQTCALVNPQVAPDERLSNTEELKNNVSRRNMSLDVNKLADAWSFFSILNNIKIELQQKKDLFLQTYAELKSGEKISESDLEKLSMRINILHGNIKDLKNALRPIEENLMESALALPNVLHPKTTDRREPAIETFGEKPTKCERSHADIGTEAGILKYLGPYGYYLMNEAAAFESSAKFYFNERLRNAGYVQFSNPDFVKSAVVEGCGFDRADPDKVFILHQDEDATANEMRSHLTGGGSLFAFAAYHARNIVPDSSLPLKFFSMGRQYGPVKENENGLFEVSQSSVVEIFIANKDGDFESALNDVTEIYRDVGYHFRTCHSSARDLMIWESARVKFEMYSPFLDKYIEVGHISASDDYISRRLQFYYRERKTNRHPKIVSGTILNVPKMLGCVLESDSSDGLRLPDCFKNMF